MSDSINPTEFEQRIQMYEGYAEAEVRETGYDAILHDAVVSEICRDKTFYRWTADELTEDSFDEAFSDPETLNTAYISYEVFQLITKVWPNSKSGLRSVPVLWEEASDWLEGSENWSEDGSPINVTPDSGGPWHIPKMLDCLHPDFLSRTFDLILELDSKETVSAWPVSSLYDSGPFRELWREFGHELHELNPKYPLHSGEKEVELFNLTLKKSNSYDRDVSLYFMTCSIASTNFKNGNRVKGFSEIQETVGFFPRCTWHLGYLDHEIQRSSLKKQDLEVDEWLQMFKASVTMAQVTYSTDGYSRFYSPESLRGITACVDESNYWIWRTGSVIALGLHLIDTVTDLALGDNLEQFSAELIKEANDTPLTAALELMHSLRFTPDWDTMHADLRRIYSGLPDDYLNGVRPEDYESHFDYLTRHSTYTQSWLLKLGFTWQMRAFNLSKLQPTSTTEDEIIEELNKEWTKSEFEQLSNIVGTSVQDSNQNITEMLSDIQKGLEDTREEIRSLKSRDTYSVSDEDLISILGKPLFDLLGGDPIIDLKRAEAYYADREKGDAGYMSGQHYANSVEAPLSNWLAPLVTDFYKLLRLTPQDRPRIPKGTGDWSRSLKEDVLRLASPNFDFSKFWPAFDHVLIERLSEKLWELTNARSEAHSGICPMWAQQARDLVLGESAEGTGPGILQMVAELSGRNLKA